MVLGSRHLLLVSNREAAKAQRAFLLVRGLARPPQILIHANQTKKGFGFATSWLWVLFVSVLQIPFLNSGKLDSDSEADQYGSSPGDSIQANLFVTLDNNSYQLLLEVKHARDSLRYTTLGCPLVPALW